MHSKACHAPPFANHSPVAAYVRQGLVGMLEGRSPDLRHSRHSVLLCSPRVRTKARASSNGRNCCVRPFSAGGRPSQSRYPVQGTHVCQLPLHLSSVRCHEYSYKALYASEVWTTHTMCVQECIHGMGCIHILSSAVHRMDKHNASASSSVFPHLRGRWAETKREC